MKHLTNNVCKESTLQSSKVLGLNINTVTIYSG